MRPLLTLAFLLLLAAGPAGAASTPAEPALILRGKVVDMTGKPVSPARFVIEAKKRTAASVDQNGAFALMLPLPTPERLRAAPCSLRVFAMAKGMRLVLPNGDPALSLSLRIVHADSADQVVARSNDERVAAMAALAVATRKPLTEIEGLRMMGLEGERVGNPPPVATPHVASVAVIAPPAVAATATKPEKKPEKKPEPKKASASSAPPKTVAMNSTSEPSATKPPETKSAKNSSKSSGTKSSKSSSAPKSPSSSTASKSSGTAAVTTTPAESHPPQGTTSPATSSAPPADPPRADCGCRIKGTVELVSNPPPTEPVVVMVWVDGAPTIRDQVELALGSPRPFELLDVPCGTLQLRVQVSAERSYLLQSPAMVENLSCTNGKLIQPRIILVPRKGY